MADFSHTCNLYFCIYNPVTFNWFFFFRQSIHKAKKRKTPHLSCFLRLVLFLQINRVRGSLVATRASSLVYPALMHTFFSPLAFQYTLLISAVSISFIARNGVRILRGASHGPRTKRPPPLFPPRRQWPQFSTHPVKFPSLLGDIDLEPKQTTSLPLFTLFPSLLLVIIIRSSVHRIMSIVTAPPCLSHVTAYQHRFMYVLCAPEAMTAPLSFGVCAGSALSGILLSMSR